MVVIDAVVVTRVYVSARVAGLLGGRVDACAHMRVREARVCARDVKEMLGSDAGEPDTSNFR